MAPFLPTRPQTFNMVNGACNPSDPEPTELFQYLPPYRVVVCSSCKYAVQPNAIPRHLKDIHHIHRSRRRPFIQYISQLDLVEPEVVLESQIYEFPVPVLSVQDGFMCKSEVCRHLCGSEKRMKTHWYLVHGRPGRAFVDWRPVPIQTFFRGNLLRYFTDTTLELSTDHYGDLSQEIKARKELNIHKPTVPTIDEPLRDIVLDDPDTFLFQHFITSTCLTLASDAETTVLWQDAVPRLAQQHPFLMDGILACASLHLASLIPAEEREYTISASIHQDLAMPLFRSAIANVDDNTCHAVLIFSHLLVIYTFASEKQDERLLLVEEDAQDVFPPWLYFLRNGCSLLCDVWERITSGPIKALASAWDIPIGVRDSKTDLVMHLLSVIPDRYSPDAWPMEECKIYHDAAIELGIAFSSTYLAENFTTWDALRIWPMYASVEFCTLLKRWHPGALILLAHYCILLRRVETHWYFEGRATRLLSTILRGLDTKWHHCIKWPMEEIGISSPARR